MILRQLAVESFAGLAGKVVELRDGMNVVLGPNEAGKSTLFHALLNVLLTPSASGKREMARLAGFLPAGGGDTIGAALRFTDGGQPYRLARRWGASPSVELELPGGARVTSEEGVAGHLPGLLPAAEGTLRSVLLARQSGLEGTLGALKKDSATVNSLSDLLRRAVLELGGVPVARFRERVEEETRVLFSRWDRQAGAPEAGRGIDHPWARDVGRILAAWYEWKRLERDYRAAVAAEDRHAEAAREIEALERELAGVKESLEAQAPAFRDAQRRGELEARLREAGRDFAALKEAANRRPALEQKLEDLESRIPVLQSRAEALRAEKAAAQAADRNRRLLERFDRVERKRAALQAAEETLGGARALERGDLERLRGLQAGVARREAELAGGRITLSLNAETDLTLRVTEGGAAPEEKRVPRGGQMKVEGAGYVRLEHEQWRLEAASGDGDPARAAEALRRARAEMADALAEAGTASMAEAVEVSEAFEALKSDVRRARTELEAELDGGLYEELARRVEEAGGSAPGRPLDTVVEESVQADREAKDALEERKQAVRELEAITAAHGSADALLEKMVDARDREKKLAAEAGALTPLPPGYDGTERFLSDYRERESRREGLREGVGRARQAFYRAEADLPEESSDETRERMEAAEREFRAAERKGEALAAIHSTVEAVLAELDGDSSAGYDQAMARHVGAMTASRYARVHMGGPLPDALLREDGTPLAFELLSGGTKDVFSLALRLAMAEHFLEGREGFLVMDDPLVELDPERQKLAAGVLAGFCGEGRQLVLFTCHPSHAALFPAAHRIEL